MFRRLLAGRVIGFLLLDKEIEMMKRVMLLGVLAAAALWLAACGGSGSSAPVSAEAEKFKSLVGDPAKGQAAFESTCVSCHGPDAKGIAGLGKDLTTSEWAKGQGDPDLILFLTKGRPAGDPLNTTGVDMPPRGGNPALKDQDLADIVAYVRTLEK